ncbi:MAG: right-handed parallel beta-helix repeat-containing protein [Phycisphaerae bacterium]|nr:right-handed parallel beta-helix repeat-containing protein [Phycisphaerae bacterium]
MNKVAIICVTTVALALAAQASLATELHVASNGSDANPGTRAAPLRTIQRAADRALPGDLISVHEGVYRERINPPRGGESDTKRIVYQAAPGEKVEIKGSEVIKNWAKVQDDVWKVTLPNAFFGGFNPYGDLIRGDWFNPKGREHHTGAVYLNGQWLTEAPKLDDVLKPVGTAALWFGQVDKDNTTIWAQFKDANPNEQRVEINVRRTVFYPDRPGRNYITVRGFAMCHAATPWAPPTAEQVGLIGTHWSKGWIIENNVIRHSICAGIALGKYGDEYDNTSANTAEGYVKTIERALANGWNKETIGHHIVRNNTVSHCEQAGIVGSLGAVFSQITGNHIHDIWTKRLFTGAEMAGIKIHASIDVLIKRNRIHNAGRGLWMDWMAQGTRITGNLCYDNSTDDLFVEVDHGPFLVDNNILLSAVSLRDWSQGGAFAHNLMTGKIDTHPELSRSTPYHRPHSTAVAGISHIKGGDHRFYNNLFVGSAGSSGNARNPKNPRHAAGYGLWMYDASEFPLQTGGNVYYRGARPYAKEANPLVLSDCDPKVKLTEQGDHVLLHLDLGPEMKKAATRTVTTALLGKAKIPDLPYENPDGSPLVVDTDYSGSKRDASKPTPGPFENAGTGGLELRVW